MYACVRTVGVGGGGDMRPPSTPPPNIWHTNTNSVSREITLSILFIPIPVLFIPIPVCHLFGWAKRNHSHVMKIEIWDIYVYYSTWDMPPGASHHVADVSNFFKFFFFEKLWVLPLYSNHTSQKLCWVWNRKLWNLINQLASLSMLSHISMFQTYS